MGETGAVIIPFVVDEDLGFIFKEAERRTVDDTIAIPLKGRTVIFKNFRVCPSSTFTAA
jgi:hypothetical protein